MFSHFHKDSKRSSKRPRNIVSGEISRICGQFCFIHWKFPDYYKAVREVRRFGNEEMKSPRFLFCGAKWSMTMLPEGTVDSQPSLAWIGLFLRKEEGRNIDLKKVTSFLGVKSNTGKIYNNRLFSPHYLGPGSSYCIPRHEFETDKHKKILLDGATTFFGLFHVPIHKVNIAVQISTHDNSASLSQDLKELYLSEKATDVVIKVNDQEFRAHSLILAARSRVFASMLQHEMKEKITGVINIADYHPETFKEFLSFIYSSHPEKISSENVVDLFCAAEKYNVKELKKRCSVFMMEEMSIDNFYDLLSLAIQYNDNNLVGYSIDFFLKNVKKIVGTDKWMNFTIEYPAQSNELVAKMVNQFVP